MKPTTHHVGAHGVGASAASRSGTNKKGTVHGSGGHGLDAPDGNDAKRNMAYIGKEH